MERVKLAAIGGRFIANVGHSQAVVQKELVVLLPGTAAFPLKVVFPALEIWNFV